VKNRSAIKRKMSSNLAGAFSQTKVTKRKQAAAAEPIGVFDDLGDCCLTSGVLEEISGNKAFLRCQNRTPPHLTPIAFRYQRHVQISRQNRDFKQTQRWV